MKNKKYLIFAITILFSLISCEKQKTNMSDLDISIPNKIVYNPYDEEAPAYTENDAIVLGPQRSNPYEIDIMREAWNQLSHMRSNFSIGDIEPYVNMIYYRVLPIDTNELAILSADTSVIYFDYPLDYDIDQWGSYYHDPSVADSLFTWLYAVIPLGHPLPSIQNVEVLQECYLPDERDTHDDLPAWEDGFTMLEYVAYRITNNLDMFDSDDADYLEAIFMNQGQAEMPARSMQAPANIRSSFWDFITGVYPEGDIKVHNTTTNEEEVVKNAHIFIHNFIKIYCGPIDENGHYRSHLRFRTHCWYHVRFQNYHTRSSLYGGWKFLLGPFHSHLGLHSRYGYSYTFVHSDYGWRFAIVNNAIEMYYNYCQEFSILFPYNMRVWIASIDGNWAGSTPLFHKRLSPLTYNFFIWPLHVFLDIPDMALFIRHNNANSEFGVEDIYATVFHEFSHASHYEQVGNQYWMFYVTHIILNLGYGEHDDGLFAGYCGIGEMWGNFAGAYFTYKYLGYDTPYVYLNADGDWWEEVYRSGTPYFYPYEDWYNPGILAKIHEDSGCSITDIYNALNPEVYSLDALKASLLNQGIDEEIIDHAYITYHNWDE